MLAETASQIDLGFAKWLIAGLGFAVATMAGFIAKKFRDDAAAMKTENEELIKKLELKTAQIDSMQKARLYELQEQLRRGHEAVSRAKRATATGDMKALSREEAKRKAKLEAEAVADDFNRAESALLKMIADRFGEANQLIEKEASKRTQRFDKPTE